MASPSRQDVFEQYLLPLATRGGVTLSWQRAVKIKNRTRHVVKHVSIVRGDKIGLPRNWLQVSILDSLRGASIAVNLGDPLKAETRLRTLGLPTHFVKKLVAVAAMLLEKVPS